MLKLQLEFWQSGEEKFAYLSVARMEKVSWVSLVSDLFLVLAQGVAWSSNPLSTSKMESC